MTNPYESTEHLQPANSNAQHQLWITIALLLTCISIVIAHFCSFRRFPRIDDSPFSILSVVAIIVAVPSLALVNELKMGSVARWFCILSGVAVFLVFLVEIALGKSLANFGPGWWTLGPRLTFCSLAPMLYLVPAFYTNRSLRLGLGVLIALGYLQSIVVENPFLAPLYLV